MNEQVDEDNIDIKLGINTPQLKKIISDKYAGNGVVKTYSFHGPFNTCIQETGSNKSQAMRLISGRKPSQ